MSKGTWKSRAVRYIVDPVTGCWLWQLSISRNDYGQLSVDGVTYEAHRYYYLQKYGEIPADKVLDHKCRVKHCVNPDHLEPVPNRVNVRRGVGTKLTLDKVLDIKKMISDGIKLRIIARMFSVSPSCISAIATGANWSKH
jgi:hypothetical protein